MNYERCNVENKKGYTSTIFLQDSFRAIMSFLAIAFENVFVRYPPIQLIPLIAFVIKTSSACYFLSISAGKLKDKETEYFAISPSSPIGKLLVGKKAEDSFIWGGKKITIDYVL